VEVALPRTTLRRF